MKEVLFLIVVILLSIILMTMGIATISNIIFLVFFSHNEDAYKFAIFLSHVFAAIILGKGLDIFQGRFNSLRTTITIIVFFISLLISFFLFTTKFI